MCPISLDKCWKFRKLVYTVLYFLFQKIGINIEKFHFYARFWNHVLNQKIRFSIFYIFFLEKFGFDDVLCFLNLRFFFEKMSFVLQLNMALLNLLISLHRQKVIQSKKFHEISSLISNSKHTVEVGVAATKLILTFWSFRGLFYF